MRQLQLQRQMFAMEQAQIDGPKAKGAKGMHVPLALFCMMDVACRPYVS